MIGLVVLLLDHLLSILFSFPNYCYVSVKIDVDSMTVIEDPAIEDDEVEVHTHTHAHMHARTHTHIHTFHHTHMHVHIASFPGSPGTRICIARRAWYLFYVSMT